MGPCTQPPHAAAARSRVCHGSLYGPPIAAVTLRHNSANVPLSGLLKLLLVVSHFCHRVLHGLPIAAASNRHTVCSTHSGFGPVTGQMSEVCGDSKIDGTHLHVILPDSIISFPSRLQGHLKYLKVQCSALIL
ncbi:unnamed protein product, partial [Staurois parvus]